MVCRPSPEGSLKRYTDIPPVLDRFKKRFLHGAAGKLEIFCWAAGGAPFFIGKSGERRCLEFLLVDCAVSVRS